MLIEPFADEMTKKLVRRSWRRSAGTTIAIRNTAVASDVHPLGSGLVVSVLSIFVGHLAMVSEQR